MRVCVRVGGWGGEIERDRETERQRQRETETERDRERQRETERDRERQRETEVTSSRHLGPAWEEACERVPR